VLISKPDRKHPSPRSPTAIAAGPVRPLGTRPCSVGNPTRYHPIWPVRRFTRPTTWVHARYQVRLKPSYALCESSLSTMIWSRFGDRLVRISSPLRMGIKTPINSTPFFVWIFARKPQRPPNPSSPCAWDFTAAQAKSSMCEARGGSEVPSHHAGQARGALKSRLVNAEFQPKVVAVTRPLRSPTLLKGEGNELLASPWYRRWNSYQKSRPRVSIMAYSVSRRRGPGALPAGAPPVHDEMPGSSIR
jgi:hypothetical protein